MGNKAINTEHSGSKRSSGYYGKREDAKRESDKKRRENDRLIIHDFIEEDDETNPRR